MHPNTTDVMTLFEKGKRYLVPIFQRNYVWKMEEHWKYLWSDITLKANEREFGIRNIAGGKSTQSTRRFPLRLHQFPHRLPSSSRPSFHTT